PWLGWRWCFWISVPFMIAALVVLVRNLHVPTVRRAETRIDWAGAFLISAATTTLLIWISFADHSFAWVSWQTAAMLGGAAVLGVAFVRGGRKVREPVVPLHILPERSPVLPRVASLAIGTTMFGAHIYLGQYFQIGRGYSPTLSGWLTLPLMLGLLISSTVSGRLVTRTGRWKPYDTGGMIMIAFGLGLLS